MKKVKILLACLLLATSSWAATTIYPTADRLCRSKNANEWETLGSVMTPVDPSESYTTFELKYRAGLYAIMQFEVPNFKAIKTMSFIFTKDNAATLMGVWNYSGYDMPQNNGTSATYSYEKVTKVVGVAPKITDQDVNVIEPLAKGDNKDGVWTFAIDANTIAPTVVYKEDGTTAVVQLLLTTYAPSRDAASKIFAYNEDQTKTPHLDVEYVDYSKPVQEICYRTKSDYTGWANSSYPMHAAATNNFEITHSSCLCAVYQYWLEDFDKSMDYTFTITKKDQETNVYAWEFPYALPQKNSDPAADFATNVETVTGVALGTAKDADTYNETYLAISDRKGGVATFTIKGSDLKNVVTDARGNKIVTLLLTSQLGGNYKYYNSLSDIDDAKKPSWTFAGYANVYNETQDITYDDLQTACTNAAANDIIRVNNDLSVISRINITTNPVTIYGRTAETKINFKTRNQLMFLTKDYSGSDKTFIKNITLVNAATEERTAHGIEVNKPTALENVTIINDHGYTVGKCDVFASQANVTLVGNNVLPGGISIANDKRIDDGIDNASPRTTHTTPIAVTLANIGEGKMVVAHGWGARKDMYQLTNEGYALYVNAGNGDLKAFAVQPISLSETEDNEELIAKYKGVATDITLSRTIAGSATDYSTICLPFETTKDELGAAEVYVYSNATFNGDDVATLYFVPATDLEAGKPYLVRFAEDKENPVFEDKTITAATPGRYGDENYEFIGLFSKTQITETEDKTMMYLGSENTLYWAGENCTIKGSRGYFKAVSAPAKTARRVAISSHNAPTDIHSMHAVKATKTIINGQFVIVKDNKMFNAQGQIIK